MAFDIDFFGGRGLTLPLKNLCLKFMAGSHFKVLKGLDVTQ